MTIVFNGLENYVQSITVYFNTEGYSELDYSDSRETGYARRPEATKKLTSITISKVSGKPDIYFELYNARETMYNDLCYGWHLNDTSVGSSIDAALDKLSIETTGGLFRLIWMRKEAGSTDYVTVAEHAVNMKNIEHYWINKM
jgi:hypothetical protein